MTSKDISTILNISQESDLDHVNYKLYGVNCRTERTGRKFDTSLLNRGTICRLPVDHWFCRHTYISTRDSARKVDIL